MNDIEVERLRVALKAIRDRTDRAEACQPTVETMIEWQKDEGENNEDRP